jgi:plastocyanin
MLDRRFIALSVALGGALNSQPMRAESVQVTISNLQYSPAEIKAKIGDSVVWMNKDFVAHTATGAGGWGVNIESDKSARLVLKKPGTLDYYCRFHPNMTGKIIVQPK